MLTKIEKELLIRLLRDGEDIKGAILIVPRESDVENSLDEINSGDATIMWLGEESEG